jgi:hypothetical protein
MVKNIDKVAGFAEESLVPTSTGPRIARELAVGDEVYSPVGSAQLFAPSGITAATRWLTSGLTATLSLGSRVVRCAPACQVMVVGQSGVGWRQVSHLEVGDIVVCADGYYPTTTSWGDRRARLVGAFLGDGWVRHDTARRGYSLGLAIGTGDQPHTAEYLDLAQEVLPNHGWGRGWRVDAPGHFGLSCSSKSAWTAATDLGLGRRSRTKEMPAEAFALCRAEKLALLGGYVDADGSVAGPTTSNHGRGQVASVSAPLVEGLREMAIACGLQVTSIARAARRTNYGHADTYRFVIGADSTAEIPLWHRAKAANQRRTSRRSKGLSAQYLGGVALGPGRFARRVRAVTSDPPCPVTALRLQAPQAPFVVDGVVVRAS